MKQKLTLLILALFTTIGGVWADTYTITYKTDGSFYNLSGAAVSGGWNASKWVSNVEGKPVVTLSSTDNGALHSGNGNISVDRTYTISVTGNYVITGYTLQIASLWGPTTVTPAEGGDAVSFTSASDKVVVTGLETKSTSFTNVGWTLPSPTIVINVEDLADYTDQVTAKIQPFVDNPGTGFFRMSTANAETLSGKITTAKADGVVSLSEYNELLEDFENYVNFPATGYYLIKNYSSNEYMAFGTPVEWGKVDGLVVTPDITPANIIRLTKVGLNQYTISSQGLNVQPQTTGNINFPMTSAAGALFAFTPATADNLIITNEDSYIDATHPGTLFDPKWNKPSGVVNWQAYGDPGRWTIEAAENVTITLTPANDNTDAAHTYATLCVPFEITGMTGAGGEVKAYAPTKDGDYIVPGTGATTVAAGTPVVLIGEDGTTSVTLTIGSGYAETPATTNILTGTFIDIDIDPSAATGTNFVLGFDADNNDLVGFYHVNKSSITLGANRAYLHSEGSGVKGFVINFGDDATGIETMVNGQTSMVNEIFNLAGQRLTKAQKGINIINGKKILK